jgi:hypothetical protein
MGLPLGDRCGVRYSLVDRVPETADGEVDARQASGGGALVELVGRLDAT